MYSILPTIAATLFLVFGLCVVNTKGLNRVTTAFLIICLTTFFWQFAWAILFQTNDENNVNGIIKVGWLLILFLPTSLYHFLTEITGRNTDLKFVYLSYLASSILAVALITTNTIINGYHEFFFGYYPKAGILHPVHVLQTCIVVMRGLYITYKKQSVVQAEEKTKLRYCIVGILIYFFAAIDYLCNYGIEFYPPGVVFICLSLGTIAIATTRYHIMDSSRVIAASIAHEIRTPLATLRAQAQILSSYLPELIENYVENNTNGEGKISKEMLHNLSLTTSSMQTEAKSINNSVDSLLTFVSYEFLDEKDFHFFSVTECINEAIDRTKEKGSNIKISHNKDNIDFIAYASKEFLTFVFVNLIKNATEAIEPRKNGNINIEVNNNEEENYIKITDTGTGIKESVLPHIFDRFFTTKKRGKNIGVGLAFSKSVVESFGGDIYCDSEHGEGTTFTISFQPIGQNKL